MNTDKENIPTQVFDYMQQTRFELLTDEQQSYVLTYISKKDFNAMHETIGIIKKSGNELSAKDKLLIRFDAKNKTHLSINTSNQINLLKIAAVLLLSACIAIPYFMWQHKGGTVAMRTLKDTVYIVKNILVDPVKTHDTIYLSYEDKKHRHEPVQTKQTNTSPSQIKELPPQSNLNILSLDELNKMPNNRKGTSLKDDTLLSNFEFVKL